MSVIYKNTLDKYNVSIDGLSIPLNTLVCVIVCVDIVDMVYLCKGR